MRVHEWTLLMPGRCRVWIVALCSLPLASGAPASNPSPVPVEQQYSALAAQVLADPNWFLPANTGTVLELERMKRELTRQRSQALELLAAGLEDYRKSRWESANKRLREVVRSPYVQEVARAALGDPNVLSEILKKCDPRPEPKFCARCEHSGIYCCGPEMANRRTVNSEGCGGWGRVLCRDCNGRGRQFSGNQFQSQKVCPECRGKGCIACDLCDGRGTRLCDCVAKLQESLDVPDAQELQAADRLISLAWHLRAGGVDLYTPDALRPAPVLP